MRPNKRSPMPFELTPLEKSLSLFVLRHSHVRKITKEANINTGFLCYFQLVFAFARLFKLSVLVQEILDELCRICDELGARALFIVRGISVLGIRAGLSFHSREQLAADY